MSFPAFFDQAPKVQVHDPLSEFLGVAEGGRIEYGYADAVRLAGHSCPTVAGAYLMARVGLRALFPDGTAERGGVQVTMSSAETDGTTGVIAQVFTLLTGAAADNGFHGIGGRFVRSGLLRYGGGFDAIAEFRRVDTGAGVRLALDFTNVPSSPQMRMLMGQALAPDASAEVRKAFGEVWQDRVRRLLQEHSDDPDVILVARVS